MTPDCSSLRVLIVDDDPISRAILEEHLGASGHDVFSADSAARAMYMLEHSPVHIVLADWIMPEMTGVDLCRWVRSRTLPRSPHFVMITSFGDRERLVEAFEAGADDYLSKPFHEAELMARFRAWTRLVSLQEALAVRHQESSRLASELIILNKRLADLATQDELTGLGNRRAASQQLGALVAVAARYQRPLTIASIDIDGFKKVNDTYGHASGDHVLKHVAGIMKETTRAADQIFRLGGDEFLVILPHDSLIEAKQWAERFRQAVLTTSIEQNGSTIGVTVSIGLAERTTATDTADKLLNEADIALYAAKHAGRNTIRNGSDSQAA